MAVTTGTPDEEPNDRADEKKTDVNFGESEIGVNFGQVVGGVHFHEKSLTDFSEGLWKSISRLALRKQDPPKTEKLASKREDIYLGVLRQKSRHAEVNHWLSVLFIVVGVGIIAAGPIMALVRAEVMPLLVSLFGAGFAAVGLWLRAHVRQNDAALESRVDRIEQRIDEDARWEKATKLIETFENPEERDRLRADAVRWMLNPKAGDTAATAQPLPEGETEPRNAIEPGDSKP